MESGKNRVYADFDKALDFEVKNKLTVIDSPNTKIIHSIPRLLIVFKGKMSSEYYENGKVATKVFEPGSFLYCSRTGYLYGGGQSYPYEGLSISFYGKYIRCHSAIFDGVRQPPTELDAFYHTKKPLSAAGQHVIKAIDTIAALRTHESALPDLFKSLLQLTLEDLKHTESAPVEFSSYLWTQIDSYLRMHREENITRESVAKHFGVSPGHVSHLFQRFSGMDFSTTVTVYRLEHGANMLNQTELSINEIAFRCGYNYASYFIRRFRKYYGVTPKEYRDSFLHKKPEPLLVKDKG